MTLPADERKGLRDFVHLAAAGCQRAMRENFIESEDDSVIYDFVLCSVFGSVISRYTLPTSCCLSVTCASYRCNLPATANTIKCKHCNIVVHYWCRGGGPDRRRGPRRNAVINQARISKRQMSIRIALAKQGLSQAGMSPSRFPAAPVSMKCDVFFAP